jgi:tripartite-type tricarboxylate transporter receptor subunit TctC
MEGFEKEEVKMKRAYWFRGLQVIVALVLISSASQNHTTHAAETYPNRPITMILGFSPGGPTDLALRALTDCASKTLNQPISIIFKPGGATSVSLSILKGEKPDGYTLGVMASGGVRASLFQKVPYDPIEDFTHIMQFGEYEFGLAALTNAPWKTMKQFLDYAKNNPDKIRYSSAGVGGGGHIPMERLAMEAGIKWLHIPYDGDAPACIALLGGHVDAAAGGAGGWKSFFESGKFRLLSVFMEKRVSSFPEVPTLIELGYNIVTPGPVAIAGPKGLPEPIVAKLNQTFKKCMEDPTFIKTAERFGVATIYRGPQELKEYLKWRMIEEEGKAIQKLGLRK